MITLPANLQAFMQGQDLKGLKPFALLFRNKWVDEESGSGTNGHYELDSTPIDISDLIVKPNTLSMTLDVNEISQYNCNNVTLTLSDTKGYFIEETPNSFFPAGYQIYGSRVVLYYGLDSVNRTAIFTGSIKDLPTHKPEKYQVDIKLVSPLEMLKDIEAKDFSDKVIGETLTFVETDSDGHKIYQTTGTGVGGFSAVYANGVKLFEGVDYEVDNTNQLGVHATVKIINSALYSDTITADYYTWKQGLTVEQIVAGLVALAGYNSGTEDIQNVAWNTAVRNPPQPSDILAGVGYYESATHEYKFNWRPTVGANWSNTQAGGCTNMLPSNFDYTFNLSLVVDATSPSANFSGVTSISLGDEYNGNSLTVRPVGFSIDFLAGVTGVNNGISVRILRSRGSGYSFLGTYVHQITNGTPTLLYQQESTSIYTPNINVGTFKISRRGNTTTVYLNNVQIATCTISGTLDYLYQGQYKTNDIKNMYVLNQLWTIYNNSLQTLIQDAPNPFILSDVCDKTLAGDTWGAVNADLGNTDASYLLVAYFSDDLATWTAGQTYNLDTAMARSERYLYYVLAINSAPSNSFDIKDPTTYYLATTLLVNLVNLTGLTVLEALQDLALISGYEFGVDRNGVFFFRPRISSTTPVYDLDADKLVKVDTVKKNLSDFFTKLTLTFAQVPLEFYANTGTHPTLVDKYGVINKEIDKPDIVNYDNPELAQAIGPQLLEVYSSLPNVIQAVGKLDLALELGDIVNLKRNLNLIRPNSDQDAIKYVFENTYYRACKITGMNYNFDKKQITYTLRDVSNSNNAPQMDFYAYVYELPVKFGLKEQ